MILSAALHRSTRIARRPVSTEPINVATCVNDIEAFAQKPITR